MHEEGILIIRDVPCYFAWVCSGEGTSTELVVHVSAFGAVRLAAVFPHCCSKRGNLRLGTDSSYLSGL